MPIDTIAKNAIRLCARLPISDDADDFPSNNYFTKKIVLELKRVFRILIFGEKKVRRKNAKSAKREATSNIYLLLHKKWVNETDKKKLLYMYSTTTNYEHDKASICCNHPK